MAKNKQATTFVGKIEWLFTAGLYKRSQGKVIRQTTAGVIALVMVYGAYTLSMANEGGEEALHFWVPGIIAIVGGWFSFRVVNWPKFADFLIATEAEMRKVTWPSKQELKRGSIVVIVTIFFLSAALFVFDGFWNLAFKGLRNILG